MSQAAEGKKSTFRSGTRLLRANLLTQGQSSPRSSLCGALRGL